jgi:hypothetical protein
MVKPRSALLSVQRRQFCGFKSPWTTPLLNR